MGVSCFGAGRLILVVDDQRDFCVAMDQLLTSLGFRVISVTNGVEALEALKTEPIAIILTDLFMPEMDGVELIRRLTSDPDKNVPPIIAVTGNTHIAAESVGAAAALLGAHSVLMKPFSVEQLAGAISFAVSQAKKLMRGAV